MWLRLTPGYSLQNTKFFHSAFQGYRRTSTYLNTAYHSSAGNKTLMRNAVLWRVSIYRLYHYLLNKSSSVPALPKDEENFGLIDFVLLQCVLGRLWRNCPKLQGLLAFLVETARYRGLLTWRWKLPNAANANEIIEDLAGNRAVWCKGAPVLQSSLRRQRGPPIASIYRSICHLVVG